MTAGVLSVSIGVGVASVRIPSTAAAAGSVMLEHTAVEFLLMFELGDWDDCGFDNNR